MLMKPPSLLPVAGGDVRDHRLAARFIPRQRGLKPLSLTIEPGEVLALIGPSGSGKTTVLRAIAGLCNRLAGGS